MKVLIFTETYHPVIGGGETQARLLAEGLAARGHTAAILTRRSDPAFAAFERIGAVDVHRIPPAGNGQFKKWGLLISSIPALLRLRRRYDLVFVSGFRIIGVNAVLMSRLLGKKCVLKSDSQGEMSGEFFFNGLRKHGLTPRFLPFRLFLALRNAILMSAHGFSAISNEIASEYRSRGIRADRLRQIPNSVDTRRFFTASAEQKAGLRQKLGLPAHARVVIYTGRLVSYKGLPLLLNVWQQIHAQHPDAILLLVGEGGLDIHNCETELREYVRANRLEGSVRFTGSVTNVPDYLQASDIYAFPTQNDAFPSSLIEAMTSSLAVVTTPVGAIKDIVTDGVDGILVPPGSAEALYQALDSLLQDPQRAGELGRRACESASENYASDIITSRYLALFEQVLT